MVMHEIRYAARRLRQTPAFAWGAIATIGLSVGATTAIFSVVYGVLVRGLPYREVDRVAWIWSDRPGRDRSPFNVPDFIDYRDSIRTLSGFAGYFAWSANLNDEAQTERVQGLRATADFFEVLGAAPRAGRLLHSADARAGADGVVVLGEAFWIRRFGADPGLIGKPIRLDGTPYTVVGVLPAGFATPIRDADVVIPFVPDRDARRGSRGSLNFIHGVGRLRDGVTIGEAASELTAFATTLQKRFPVENATKRGVRIVGLIEGIAGPFRTALLTIFGAVAAVLLTACANLANLMLTRAAGRAHAIAVQRAFGASRTAIVRQVLIEALLLAAAGGAAGVWIARLGVAGLLAAAPAGLPRIADIRVDTGVLSFALAVSIVAGLLFGIAPALVSSGLDVRDALDGGGRATGRSGGLRRFLVGCEVALAVVLVTTVVLLAKSFTRVHAVTPGFDTARVLSARLTLPAGRFRSRPAILTLQRAIVERLAALPGAERVGAVSLLPLTGLLLRVPFTIEGHPVARESVPVAQYRMATPGYFEAAGIPLRRGRLLSDQDTDATRPVALVSEAFARAWLGELEPIGTRVLVDDNDAGPRPLEIVGVVGNVQQIALDGPPTWDLYLPYSQMHPDNAGLAAGNMFVVVRTAGDPMSAATMLAREVRRVDPDVAASQIQLLGRYVSDAIAPRRFSLSLMAAFGAAALLLAATGVYAVVLYTAGQRRDEIRIRVALGAGRWRIVRLVMREGLLSVTAGLAVGAAATKAATPLLSSMLFGVPADDTASVALVVVAVAAIGGTACVIPGYFAGKTETYPR